MTDLRPPDDRRLRRLELSCSVLRGSFALARRWFRFQLPPDAKLVNAGYDVVNDTLQLLIQSEEFSPIDLGVIVPAIDLVIESREEDEQPDRATG